MDEDTPRTVPTRALALDRELDALPEAVAAIPDRASRERLDRAIADIGAS